MSIKLKLAALLIATPILSQAIQRTELLPATAQSHIQISNITDVKSQFKKSSFGKLWADDQFQDFMGNPDADNWKDFFFDQLSEEEKEVITEQFSMLQGEVIVAFDNQLEMPVLIANMSKEDFEKSLEMDTQLYEKLDNGVEIVKHDFQGVEIIQSIEPADPELETEESITWQAHLKETLLLGFSKEWIEKSIVQLQSDDVEEPKGIASIDLKLSLATFIQQHIETEDANLENQPGTMSTQSLFDALALTDIGNYMLHIKFEEDALVLDSQLQTTELTKGIFSILDTQPSFLPTVSFIPPTITSLEVGRFDLLNLWKEIPVALDEAAPGLRPQFDMIQGMIQQSAGIDLEQDLLSNMDSQYLAFSVIESNEQLSLIAIELNNSMALKATIEKIIEAPALQSYIPTLFEITEFLDHTMYEMITAEEPLAFAVTGDYLVYGHPKGIQQVIRSQNSDDAANGSFEQLPLVQELRQQVPRQAFAFSAIDWKTNMDHFITELNKSQYTQMIQDNWAQSGSALPPPDFSKLPSAQHISSFFNISYQYLEETPRGLHHKLILKY